MKILREHKWIYELEMLNYQFQMATRARDEREFEYLLNTKLSKRPWWRKVEMRGEK